MCHPWLGARQDSKPTLLKIIGCESPLNAQRVESWADPITQGFSASFNCPLFLRGLLCLRKGCGWISLVNQFWNTFCPGPLQRFQMGFQWCGQGVLVRVTHIVTPHCVPGRYALRFRSSAFGWCLSLWVPSKLPWRVGGALQLGIRHRIQKSNKIASPTSLITAPPVRAQPETEKQTLRI